MPVWALSAAYEPPWGPKTSGRDGADSRRLAAYNLHLSRGHIMPLVTTSTGNAGYGGRQGPVLPPCTMTGRGSNPERVKNGCTEGVATPEPLGGSTGQGDGRPALARTFLGPGHRIHITHLCRFELWYVWALKLFFYRAVFEKTDKMCHFTLLAPTAGDNPTPITHPSGRVNDIGTVAVAAVES